MGNIKYLFEPENIAVVGASSDRDKAGNVILQNLIRKGYPKKIFPVNPRGEEILGLKTYKSLDQIEDKVELLVLITPSPLIFSVMEDLEKRMEEKNDIKAIVVAAAGYAETHTEEGAEREKCLMDTAKKYGIRVVGPNCIGVIDSQSKVDTTFVETGSKEAEGITGGISLVSQSGSLATILLMEGASTPAPIGFNKFISVGNMSDVDFIDLLEHLEDDDSTSVIGLYLEGYPKARKLIDTMARIAKKKPIVVLKVGKSEKGAVAASSHTGSLAGSDKVYDSAFNQHGIIRVDTMDELLDTLVAFDELPLPKDEKVYILTQAGGPGIYSTDLVSLDENMFMPKIKEETEKDMLDILPEMASVGFPEGYADITAAANVEQHTESLKLVLEDPNVSSVIFITILPTFVPQKQLGESLAKMYIDSGFINEKPVYFTIMAGDYVLEARKALEDNGIHTIKTPDRAVKVASNLVKYSKFISENRERSGE